MESTVITVPPSRIQPRRGGRDPGRLDHDHSAAIESAVGLLTRGRKQGRNYHCLSYACNVQIENLVGQNGAT
jgi:hypothetical protein